MVYQHPLHQLHISLVFKFVDPNHCPIEPGPESFVLVQNKNFSAAHPGSEILSRSAEDHHNATGHVLASMIAHSFDDGHRPRVPHRETSARPPVEISLAACRALYKAGPPRSIAGAARSIRR